jgi:Mycoplasma protein of unknown function, DUF285
MSAFSPIIVDRSTHPFISTLSTSFGQAKKFNGNIGGWDVRKGVIFHGMFVDTLEFNQDLSAWQPEMGADMKYMFLRAAAYNTSLCAWVPYLSNERNFSEMFLGSACRFTLPSPSLTEWDTPGPFCDECPGAISKVPGLVEGPFVTPLIPAAMSQRPDNLIITWSGDMPYAYFASPWEVARNGTFVSTFNPVNKTSTRLRIERTYAMRTEFPVTRSP